MHDISYHIQYCHELGIYSVLILYRIKEQETGEIIPIANGNRIALFTTSIAIENNLKIVEVPITFKKRIGISKFTNNKWKGLASGFEFIWFILRS